ncbi:MAG TPA: sulfite exporter TauE/SafE family protein [Vicinamibacterales bacterium]|nr:sulfite exporter TauE/SafE family protein [Vicinamibacterales bacterium]
MPPVETTALVFASIVAGGIGSVTGFGIGSILTPLLSLWVDGRLAVAMVAVPHFIGTAVRFTTIDGRIDRWVMWRFGLASAAGGLTGALFQSAVSGPGLMVLLAVLLLLVAVSELSRLSMRMRFTGAAGWIAGVLSGMLGGLVGNQGGIRSAALLGFGLPRDAFVATATAIALFVDGARLPIYLFTEGAEMWNSRSTILIATAGVVTGTIAGARVLRRIPERTFRKIVALLLAALGVALLARLKV